MEKKIIMTELEREEFKILQEHFCKSPSDCIKLGRLTALTILTSIEVNNGDVEEMIKESFTALRLYKI